MQKQAIVIVMVTVFTTIPMTLFLIQDLMRNNAFNTDDEVFRMHGLYPTALNYFFYGKVTSIPKAFSHLMYSYTYTNMFSKVSTMPNFPLLLQTKSKMLLMIMFKVDGFLHLKQHIKYSLLTLHAKFLLSPA